MLVTTAIVGESLRNEPSRLVGLGDQEFALRRGARWRRARARAPPTTTVGSKPPAPSTAATIEVVVVLPCVPAIAMPYFRRISSASISARAITGMPR